MPAVVLAMALSLSAGLATQQNQVANVANDCRPARGIRPVARSYQLTGRPNVGPSTWPAAGGEP